MFNSLSLHISYLTKVLALTFSLILFSCQKTPSEGCETDLPEILQRKELRAITLESSLSYFTDGEEKSGYEYDLCRDYAESLDVSLKIIVAYNLEEMRQMLLDGRGDLIAYRMPMSSQNKAIFSFSSNRLSVYPVLVQPARGRITDVTELVGKEVFTRKYSRYWVLLNHLNAELGGGIQICEIDSLNVDQLILKVANEEIPLTIVDNEVAKMNRKYVPNINCNVVLGLPQEYGWAVRKSSKELLASINTWYEAKERYYQRIRSRYFEKNDYFEELSYVKKGSISSFDSIFQKYAPEIGWDWRLLAAVSYHESHFNPQTISYAGAIGLMQLMPRTAERFGLDSLQIFDPEKNVQASVGYIRFLDRQFSSIKDEQERLKFILASYNSGPAHVFDAVALASKYGKNTDVWFNGVENYLMLKNKPEYYEDPVCKYGYFRANHTIRYVRDVLNKYNEYCGIENK